jgi:hypothetical protein
MSPLLDPANGKVGANVNRHEDDVGRLARNWKFESIPLPRRVRKPSVPLDVVAASTSSATSSTEPPRSILSRLAIRESPTYIATYEPLSIRRTSGRSRKGSLIGSPRCPLSAVAPHPDVDGDP